MALADEGRGVMALIQRLRDWKSPWRGDGDEETIPLAAEAADAIEKLNAFAAHKVECAMLIVLEVENEELCDCGLTDLRTQIFGKDG